MALEQATHFEPIALGERLPTRLITARGAQALVARAHHLHARRGATHSLYNGEVFFTDDINFTTIPQVPGSAPDLTSQGAMLRLERPYKTPSTHVALQCEFYVSNLRVEVELWRTRHVANDGADTLYSESLLQTITVENGTLLEEWGAVEFEMVASTTRYIDVGTGEFVALPFEVRYKVARKQTSNSGVLISGHATELWYGAADTPLVY